MADYKCVYVAHFETCARRMGCASWGTKEFDTKWEAEKFLHEYQQKHWYASHSGWVDAKTIDLRTPSQKAYDEKVQARVAERINDYLRNWN